MNLRRGNNGFARNPISESDLAAWMKRRGIVLEPFENQALDSLEAMYLNRQAKQKDEEGK